jgi:hypothetical protein
MALTKPQIVTLPKILDPRGNLSFIQNRTHLPFDIKRCYWIYDVPGGEMRYGRALRSTSELIVALSGSFDVVVTAADGTKTTYQLNRSYNGLLLPEMTWRSLENFSTNSVAMVLASTVYDEADYIRDFNQYQQCQ